MKEQCAGADILLAAYYACENWCCPIRNQWQFILNISYQKADFKRVSYQKDIIKSQTS